MLVGPIVFCSSLKEGLIDSYEKRACNFHSDCTVGKILIVAIGQNGSLSMPVLGECF